MKPISTDLEIIFQPVQLREDEYLDGETNLIYCSRCWTPRQKRFEMTGKFFEPRCMCACLTRNCGNTPLKMILGTTPNK